MKDINNIKLSSRGDRIYADRELIGSVHFRESTFIDEERREGESWIAMRGRTAEARLKLEEKATQYASMFAAAPELLEALSKLIDDYDRYKSVVFIDKPELESAPVKAARDAISKALGQ